MAAATFCSMSHGYGVNKLNDYLLNSAISTGKSRFLFIFLLEFGFTDAGQRALCTRICFNKTAIRQLHSEGVRHGILLKCRAEHTESSIDQEKEERISTATLLWRAIKLPIYTVALVPITVGSAAAYLQTGQYIGKRYLMLVVSSVFIIAWLNLSNDVYDFDTGADKNKKESVVNLVGDIISLPTDLSPLPSETFCILEYTNNNWWMVYCIALLSRTGTHIFAWLLLALGLAGLTWASLEAGSLRPISLLAYAVICGYIYQCPPFRFSYLGLGEPLCFAAFGPFATTAFYWLQGGTRLSTFSLPDCIQELTPVTDFCYDDRELSLSSTILSSSILVGFTTSLILFCSHFHQVRLGTEGGAKVVKFAVGLLYSLLFILGLGRSLPFSAVVLGALTLPMGKFVVSFVEENHR
ncbi:UNVERIFIED_CONTAM: 2-carboxy-1,4-naphthoquinone phytyltransferase, chloroplastic [Sesamum radiatum]|uniref:2-carboxy-1,4-naphthoquinone phytyltransferase, chloroplastic n=1 Tax=Sesamum radiatum TaxID=300843 RepID=A0AAW2MX43_SESRA